MGWFALLLILEPAMELLFALTYLGPLAAAVLVGLVGLLSRHRPREMEGSRVVDDVPRGFDREGQA